MHKFAIAVVRQLMSQDIIEANQEALCIYEVERRISTFMSFCILMVVGTWVSSPLPAFAFISTVLFLRARTSGYHARSYITCLMLSIVAESIILLLILPVMTLSVCVCLMVISYWVIWHFAPVNHMNLQLEQEELAVNKKASRLRLVIVSLIAVGLVLFSFDMIAYSVSLGTAFTSDLIVVAHIVKQEG